jgi:threonine aldolase
MLTSAVIDLRSDTLTVPSQHMRQAMASAQVGDAAYGEDAVTGELERRCAAMLGKAAAVFMPTGTMSNQVALRAHTRAGDEVVIDASYHINYYESAATSDLANVVLNCTHAHDGVLTPQLAEAAVASKPRAKLYALPTLLCLENTVAAHGGRVFPQRSVLDICEWAHARGMRVHLDGARLLNASVAGGRRPAELAAPADSVSLCFAKGLSAPYGSVLAGSEAFVERALVYRKWMGGCVHQIGQFAAAALCALDHNIGQLARDHDNARCLARLLAASPLIDLEPETVDTNIVVFRLGTPAGDAEQLVEECSVRGVRMLAWPPGGVRAMTRAGITHEDVVSAAAIIKQVAAKLADAPVTV